MHSSRVRLDDPEALAADVRARMTQLHLSVANAVQLSGLSDKTISKIRNADQAGYDIATLSAVSRALGWGERGILDPRVRSGDKPPDDDTAPPVMTTHQRMRRIEDRMDKLEQAWQKVEQALGRR